jgi:integrase
MKGTIRPRGREAWQLVYDLPPGPDGKRRQKTETVRGPKKAAQIRLREVLGAVDQGRVADPGKMTVGEYLDDWLAGLTRAGTTIERYEQNLRNHIKPELGHLRLSALTTARIEALYKAKLQTHSGASVQLMGAILGKALGRAAKIGLISRNPCHDVEEKPKAKRKEARFLAPEEKARFVAATEGSPYRALLLTLLGTGLRLSEARALGWKHVDLDAGVIHVRRNADRHNVIIDTLKTETSRRTITIPGVLVGLLREHHKYLLEEKLRLRHIWQDLGLVFPRSDGGVLGISALDWPMRKLCEKAGVSISPHSLRHTHASDLIAAGVHAKVVQERLGHASIVITLDRYGHLFPGSQDQAAKAIDAMLKTVM